MDWTAGSWTLFGLMSTVLAVRMNSFAEVVGQNLFKDDWRVTGFDCGD